MGSTSLAGKTGDTFYGWHLPWGVSTAAALLLALGTPGCKAIAERRLPATGVKPIHRAAAHDDVGQLERVDKAKVNTVGSFGWTPLHFAAIYDAPGAAALLIKRGAAVDALDRTGMTPLHWAARPGNHRVVEVLLQGKAEVMARNMYDMTPLHEARSVAVAELLLARGADKEARNIDGMTPLHTAATREVAQFLIKKGCNLNAKAKDGRTPMDMPPVPVPRVP